MLIRNIDDVQLTDVKMDGVNGARMALMVGRGDGAPNFSLRQFSVEPGGNTPRHSHDYEHEVYVISGTGTFMLLGEERPIRGGDVIYVPADDEHQFRAGNDQPLRFLCAVPASRNCGDPTPGS
jgi:quercetin dioxygenase-like cupin family protein